MLQLTGSVAENWKRSKQRFEIYLLAIVPDNKTEKMKAAILLHVIRDDTMVVYNHFTFENGDNWNLKAIIDKFEAFCIPERNVTYERYKFFTCKQKAGQTIDQFVTELRNHSKTCEFAEFTDSLIKDRIVCCILDNDLRERLLEKNLNLEKAVELCKASETAMSQAKELFIENGSVDAVKCKHIRKK